MFQEFPKIARLSREVLITEKIDGTNAQVFIQPYTGNPDQTVFAHVLHRTETHVLMAGSRTRFVTLKDDNYGFARWASEHAEELMLLGPGRHFGEWWGAGIQRGYGVPDKRWSLFNVTRWHLPGHVPVEIPTQDPRVTKTTQELPACCGLVPTLWRGIFDTLAVESTLADLAADGSWAAPGFMKPEGIVAVHIAGNIGFKKTLDGDGAKGARK